LDGHDSKIKDGEVIPDQANVEMEYCGRIDLFSQLACSVRTGRNIVKEDRVVKGETQSHGVSWPELAFRQFESLRVGSQSTIGLI